MLVLFYCVVFRFISWIHKTKCMLHVIFLLCSSFFLYLMMKPCLFHSCINITVSVSNCYCDRCLKNTRYILMHPQMIKLSLFCYKAMMVLLKGSWNSRGSNSRHSGVSCCTCAENAAVVCRCAKAALQTNPKSCLQQEDL